MSNDKRDRDEVEMEMLAAHVRRVLSPLKKDIPEVSPYLKTRVLAELRAGAQRPQTIWSWLGTRWAAGAAFSVAAVALGTFSFLTRDAGYQAVADQPVAVRVDMKEFKSKGISHARVELSKNIHFYSQKFPEVRAKESLELSWKDGLLPSTLPIVVESNEKGTRTVRVKFFNDENRVVAERVLKIRFGAAGRQSSSGLVERG